MKSSRKWLAQELSAFAASLPAGCRVLDAGAGDQRYKGLFAGHIYEAADFEQVDKPYAKSTYVCDLTSIPVPDATYDAIVFTQVMEHLSEPGEVLKEFHRIGKNGCRIFYSAPLCSDEHEVPYDFYRYTQFGVRHLFSKAGFEVQDVHGMEGCASTAAYHLKRMLSNIPRSPKALGGTLHAWAVVGLIAALRPLLKLLTRQLEASDSEFRYTKAGFPLNYIAIARKVDPT